MLDDLRVNLDERRVCRGDDVLAVTARSYELLRFLIEEHPRIVAPREIIAGVWPRGVVSVDAVTQRVKLLRRQLGGGNERYVATIHGIGYRLAVAPRPISAAAHAPASQPAQRASAGRRWLSMHPLLAGALGALLAVGVLAGAVIAHDPPHALKHALKHQLGGGNQR